MTPAQTIPEILRHKAEQSPQSVVFRYLDRDQQWQSMSLQDYFSTSQQLACSFRQLGLNKGQRVGIVAPNCVEWELIHMALLSLGAVVVGMDRNDTSERLQQIAAHAELSALIIFNSSVLDKFNHEFLRQCKFIITIDESSEQNSSYALIRWNSLLNTKCEQSSVILPDPHDAATIIYTSGTTGEPKGIVYQHQQLLLACQSLSEAMQLSSNDRYLCWLPLSSLFQRIVNLCALYSGGLTHVIGDPAQAISCAQQVQPTIFVAVPRFYEKLYKSVQRKIAATSFLPRQLISISVAIAENHAKYLRERSPTPWILPRLWRLADYLVLRKIRSALGGNIRFLISGSAPISLQLLKFFHAVGLPILEAYGLSENVVPVTINRPREFRLGTVGKPLPANEIKISAEGEILIRGPGVFHGYYKDTTSSCFVLDGFYATGDFAEMDADGFVYLKGRKAELIKTSSGRRIAPLRIETHLRQISYVDQAIVIGAGRKCLIAIITFDWDVLSNLAKELGLSSELVHDELPFETRVWISNALGNHSSHLARHERPAGFLILRSNFSAQSGELTPNLKLKRHFIEKKYTNLIDQFYGAIEQKDSPTIWFISSAMSRAARSQNVSILNGTKVGATRILT